MNSHITYFSCSTCGAPLSPSIQDLGEERCLYCDTISIYTKENITTTSGKIPSSVERSLGKVRRYGTVIIAPALGWSACALFNIQRHSLTYENPDGLLIGLSILSLMLLHRWVMASIWLLFCCLAFSIERAQSSYEVGPLDHFSLTSESSLMPLGICTFLIFWFLVFLFLTPKESLAHEQQKIAWRTPVALTFLLGLIAGLNYYAKPMSIEVHRYWIWAYASEMQRLTALSPSLNTAQNPSTSIAKFHPQPIWFENEPKRSNTVFMPLQYIKQFPAAHFYMLGGNTHLWLHGAYVRNFSLSPDTIRDSYFDPPIAPSNWRDAMEYPLIAPWLVLYDNNDTENVLRFWLISRGMKESNGFELPQYNFQVMGFQEIPWEDKTDNTPHQKEAKMALLEGLQKMTGGQFQEGKH